MYKTSKKILFINPPAPKKGVVIIRDLDRSGRTSMEKSIWPQTNLAYLAAIMKKEGYRVDIIDCIAEKMDWNKFERIIEKEGPDYILFNVISSTLNNDMRVAEIGKKNNAVVIAVGPHVTALPAESLREFSSLDFAILGEAEATLKELINVLEQGIPEERLKNINGIVFKTNDNQIITTPKRSLIENLDSLPIPLHELLPIHRYSLPFIGKHYTFVMTSRGCPYRCIFCRSPINWDRRVRSRSAESLIKELEHLKKLEIKNFFIHSDVFTINKDVVVELCKEIVKRGWKFRWFCNSRVDRIDKEMLDWMKKAGCQMINYGIESGSQKVLDRAKKEITIEQIKKAVYLTKKAGIKVWGYFIIGLPEETNETVNETIRLAKELPLDLVNFAVATPYPGTEFYELAKKNNWLVAQKWEDYDQNYSISVSYPDMPDRDIKRAVTKAYKKWYFRPIAVWKLLKGIRNFGDIKTLISTLFAHLKWIFF